VAYLGGRAQCDAPLWPDHEHFLQATLYEKVRFLPFSSKNCKIQQCLMVFAFPNFRKMGEFAVSIEHSEAKSVTTSGGLRPLTPDQGLCPWTPLGDPPQTPVIGSRSARSPWPPLPNPKYVSASNSKEINLIQQQWRVRICSALCCAI